MMRIATALSPLRTILGVALLLFLCSTARAEDPTAKDEPRRQRAAEIISQVEKPGSRQSWFATHLGVRKGAGVEYRHQLSVGRRDLVFSVYGPAIKKKRLGLGFEVRF